MPPSRSKNDVLQRVSTRMAQLGYNSKAIRDIVGPVTKEKAEQGGESFQHVGPVEGELMKTLHEDGMGVKKIAAALGRSTDAISKHVFKKNRKRTKSVGRPCLLPESKFNMILKAYHKLLREQKGKEVTVNMVRKSLGLKCSAKTLSRAFWKHGVHFRPLYEKPDLLPADVRARKAWAEEHQHRSGQQWTKYVHAVIDNKTFPIYPTQKFRQYAARRRVRGAYRTKRRVFTAGYTKPSATLKQNTGAKAAMVTCAIGNGKVLLWHVTKGKWNAEAAERMYSGPLRRALEREYPHVRGPWRILEDNDPAGYKSGRGIAAKASVGISTLDLPKRSPDLNPLDFSFWAAVNKKMRETESKWPNTKTETRHGYLARLRRTAMRMPTEYVNSIMAAMSGRVQQVLQFNGGFFPEGGLSD